MALRITTGIYRVIRTVRVARSPTVFLQKSTYQPVAFKTQMASNFSTNLAEIATYEEIKKLSKKPETLLIDVREPQELIDTGVVPTSINIPLGQVTEKLSKDFSEKEFLKLFNRKKPSPDTEIIFTCKMGVRANNAMEQTRKLGYKNVRNYLGSWEDWSKNEGLSK